MKEKLLKLETELRNLIPQFTGNEKDQIRAAADLIGEIIARLDQAEQEATYHNQARVSLVCSGFTTEEELEQRQDTDFMNLCEHYVQTKGQLDFGQLLHKFMEQQNVKNKYGYLKIMMQRKLSESVR